MIYTGIGRLGEIADVKAHGDADIAEVYGGIGESNPVYYKTRTLTGTLPLSYKALGKPLSDYLISGNTLQNGTPTPESPVEVVGCGVRTRNLFNYSTITTGYRIQWANGDLYADDTAIMSDYIPVTEGDYALSTIANIIGYASDKSYVGAYSSEKTWEKRISLAVSTFTVSSSSNVKFIRVFTYSNLEPLSNTSMLNSGSTPLPYEPYGYKCPVTIGGTEYPIYLGEVQTTRKIKKLVLTGDETIGVNSPYYLLTIVTPSNDRNNFICSHFGKSDYSGRIAQGNIRFSQGGSIQYDTIIFNYDNGTGGEANFKSYLAAQYAAGTPVTVWYVLAEQETAVVNEPLHKIGNYADTVSFTQAGVTIPTVAGTNTLAIGTTVQPSEVSITGNIKEVQGT